MDSQIEMYCLIVYLLLIVNTNFVNCAAVIPRQFKTNMQYLKVLPETLQTNTKNLKANIHIVQPHELLTQTIRRHVRHHKTNENHIKQRSNRMSNDDSDFSRLTSIELPELTVFISRHNANERKYSINVPLEPNMNVVDALLSATRRYTGSGVNPYNVAIDWDSESNCHVIVKAMDVKDRLKRKWTITVKSNTGKVIYRNRCFPDTTPLRLVPNSQIILSFSKTYRSVSLH